MTIPVPAGVVANDVMIAQVTVRGGAATTLTAPAGWSLVRRDNDGGGQIADGIYVHIVTAASEPASYTWNFSAGNDAAGGIAAYSGVNTAAPIDVSGGQANASSTSMTAPSITIPAGHNADRLLAVFATANSAAITLPGAVSGRWNFHAIGFGISAAMGDASVPSGATGNYVALQGSSAVNIGAQVALQPAPGSATPTPTYRPRRQLQCRPRRQLQYRPRRRLQYRPRRRLQYRPRRHSADRVANSSPTASPTPVPTASPTPVPTASPTPVPTASPTPVPTASPTPVPTASPTPVPTASPTPVPTASPTPVPTASPTPIPTASPTPVPTASPTPVPTASPTPVPTASPTPGGGQPIVLRNFAIGSTSATSNHVTIPVPTGAVANDVMIAQVTVRGGTGTTLTPPAGWSLVRRDNRGTSTAEGIYVHVVTAASEPASYTWNFTAGNDAAGGIAAYSGVNTATPVDVSGGQGNASSTSMTAPSITIPAGHNGDRSARAVRDTLAAPRITLPAALTARWNFHAIGFGISAAMGDVSVPSGATGNYVAIQETSTVNIGALVALLPAS